MAKIFEILDILRQNPTKEASEAITQSLREIKEICDRKYYDQSLSGNASLNRLMLLDSDIAERLTPEVIEFIFTNAPAPETKIKRNTSDGGVINLQDAIYFGFQDGLQVIRCMPNNHGELNLPTYQQQKQKFDAVTMLIVQNILRAAGQREAGEELEEIHSHGLLTQYERIIKTVDLIKTNEGDLNRLLHVPSYTPADMRMQVWDGFLKLSQRISIFDRKKINLDAFCDRFLQSDSAMLHSYVSHFFYDRAHIQAALESPQKLIFEDGTYTYRDLFRAMIVKVTNSPESYPDFASEQLCLRFGLVENDLIRRFMKTYQQANSSQIAQMASDVSIFRQPAHNAAPELVAAARNVLAASESLQTKTDAAQAVTDAAQAVIGDNISGHVLKLAVEGSVALDNAPPDVPSGLWETFVALCKSFIDQCLRILAYLNIIDQRTPQTR